MKTFSNNRRCLGDIVICLVLVGLLVLSVSNHYRLKTLSTRLQSIKLKAEDGKRHTSNPSIEQKGKVLPKTPETYNTYEDYDVNLNVSFNHPYRIRREGYRNRQRSRQTNRAANDTRNAKNRTLNDAHSPPNA